MKHLRQYSTIPFSSHTTQAFSHLQQGPNEPPQMCLHHASKLLSKIHHMMDISQILTEGTNSYMLVYGLNLNK